MNYDYKVIYSSRRSFCVSVDDNNAITVRCPFNASKRRIESFLNQKTGWITRRMALNNEASKKFEGVKELKNVLVGGRIYPLVICGENAITDSCVKVKGLSSLKGLYIKNFCAEFEERVNSFAAMHSFSYSSICFKAYKSRWGYCDGANNLCFNYKLLMLPRRLQDAVIAHELCHTVHHNHSPRFRRLLNDVFPLSRAMEKGLKEYAFVARLY